MKTILKNLLLLGALFLGLSSQAQTSYTGTSSNRLFSAPGYYNLQTFSATVPSGTTTVTFYDAPSTNATYVVAAYTNYNPVVTNRITTITNYYGVAYSWTNQVVVNIPTIVAQTTNFYPIIGIAAVTTTPTVTTFTGSPRAFQGILAVAASTNAVTYTAVVGN